MSNNSPKSIALRPSSSVNPMKRYSFLLVGFHFHINPTQPSLLYSHLHVFLYPLTLFRYQATQLQNLSHAAFIVPTNTIRERSNKMARGVIRTQSHIPHFLGTPVRSIIDDFLEKFQRGEGGSFPIQKISLQFFLHQKLHFWS